MQRYDITELLNSHTTNCLVYDKKSTRNILFLGSCRLAPLIVYFRLYGLDRNFYYIYAPQWHSKLHELPDLNAILSKTDIIVCETLHNYGVLNTDDGEVTFFNTFQIQADTRIYHIPNLELRMYAHDLINIYKVVFDHHQLYQYYTTSRERLRNSLRKKHFEEVGTFIDEHIHHVKLFSTHNHPMPILSVVLFKCLADKMNLVLDESFLNHLLTYECLQGNDTPLYNIDRDLYQLSFIQEIEPNYDQLHTVFYRRYSNPKINISLYNSRKIDLQI